MDTATRQRPRLRFDQPPTVAERRFPAMGTVAHVAVDTSESNTGESSTGESKTVLEPNELLQYAVNRISDLEQRWSRFRPDSEISRLNRHRQAQVSSDTFLLIDRAVRAWVATGGRFDPTMQRQLIDTGYDRPFNEIRQYGPTPVSTSTPVSRPTPASTSTPSPTCAGIVRDRFTSTVWLPDGVYLDPGGIGKGLAADIVTAELCDLGVGNTLVNLGGDLRARSVDEFSEPWLIDVVEPSVADVPITTLALRNGAVASSTPLRRAWTNAGQHHHHLIDANTGRSNANPADLVTVVAADGWWAESVATSLASSPAIGDLSFNGSATLQVHPDGIRIRTGGFERYESTPHHETEPYRQSAS